MNVLGVLRGNPASQGYCFPDEQLHALRFAVRFPVALCVPLFVTAMAFESPVALLVLAGIAGVAGFTQRHPFDLVWNHGVRRALRGVPELPPNPRMRRHAFKIGGAMLLAVAGLLAVGATTAAFVLGAMLLVACSSAAVLNLCIPSAALALLERRRSHETRPA